MGESVHAGHKSGCAPIDNAPILQMLSNHVILSSQEPILCWISFLVFFLCWAITYCTFSFLLVTADVDMYLRMIFSCLSSLVVSTHICDSHDGCVLAEESWWTVQSLFRALLLCSNHQSEPFLLQARLLRSTFCARPTVGVFEASLRPVKRRRELGEIEIRTTASFES